MRRRRKVGLELASVMLDDDRGDAGDSVMQGCGFSTMMPGEHHQHDGLLPDPQDAGIISDERLPVTGLVCHTNVAQVSREAIIHLLHFHRVKQLVARPL